MTEELKWFDTHVVDHPKKPGKYKVYFENDFCKDEGYWDGKDWHINSSGWPDKWAEEEQK